MDEKVLQFVVSVYKYRFGSSVENDKHDTAIN